MTNSNVLILNEEDLIDPKKTARTDISLEAFQPMCQPFIQSYDIVLYITLKGRYLVLKDTGENLMNYWPAP